MRTLTSVLATAGVLFASVAVGLPAAQATAAVAPSTTTGNTTTAFAITADQACPNESAETKVQVSMTGAGFPSTGYNITGKNSPSSVRSGSGYSMPLLYTLAVTASNQTPPATLAGAYRFDVMCFEGLAATPTSTLGTTYVFISGDSWVIPASSSVTLSASELIVAHQQAITVTSAVSPSEAAGTVEYFATPLSGGQSMSLGTATVSGGVASRQIQLAGGEQAGQYAGYTVSAVFTPASAHIPSTSASRSVFVLSPTAAPDPGFEFQPARGTNEEDVNLVSQVSCPAANSNTKFQVRVTGAGFPAGGFSVTGLEPAPLRQFGPGYFTGLQQTMKTYAASQNPPATLTGEYVFTWTCFDTFTSRPTAVLGTASMWFTSPTTYQTTDPALDSIETTLDLAISPVSGAVAGEPVTFTATVTPSGAVGTVAFTATPTGTGAPITLGSATVSGGTASVTYSALTGGASSGVPRSYRVVAAFTPTTSAYRASTSQERTLLVNAPLTPVNAVRPAVTGAKVGSTLLCTSGTWTDASSFRFRVTIGGVAVTTTQSTVSGVRRASYSVRPADVSKVVACTVTAVSPDGVEASSSASGTIRIAPGDAPRATTAPKVTGTMAVGQQVRVTTGTWSRSGARFTYRWVLFNASGGGSPVTIAGATGATLKVPASARGRVIGVVVTATIAGYTPGSTTVKATGRVR